MAARLRRDLGRDVALVDGDYGEFVVLVDDEVVMTKAEKPMFALLPRYDRVLAVVRAKLGEG